MQRGQGIMNGAESIVRTLAGADVEICFANPGTSEIHLVASLDQQSGLRPILCLHESVATGAADGYGRMGRNPLPPFSISDQVWQMA